MAYEVNFDGLVGPTHNYAGLSFGNVASTSHANLRSSPKLAAKQGLEKMQLLSQLGVKQALMPPHERPNIKFLRDLGFTGTDVAILNRVFKHHRALFAACFSASSMWTANAVTLSSSADCEDKRMHMTPANLTSNLHRHMEVAFTGELLKKIFPSSDYFVHHHALSCHAAFADEGAAAQVGRRHAEDREGSAQPGEPDHHTSMTSSSLLTMTASTRLT